MAYRTSFNTRRLAGNTYMASLRKTEINPGDKKKPTAYRSMSYYSAETPSKSTYANYQTKEYRESEFYLPFGARPMAGSQYWADQYDVTPLSSPLYLEAYNRALSRLISNVLDQKLSDFNAAVFMAEAGESLETIRNAAFRIAMAYRSLRKGRLRDMYRYLGASADHKYRTKVPKAQTVRDNASGYWLEGQYAWLPLLKDAYSAAEKLASIVTTKPPIFSARGRATVRSTTTGSVAVPIPYSWLQTNQSRVEIKVYYSVPSKALELAASLGLTNPALVAWELIPFSFVLDWFLPIGSFLEALSAFDGLSFHSGYVSTLGRSDYSLASGHTTVYFEGGYVDGSWGIKIRETKTYGGVRVKSVAFNRSVLYGFPRPSFPALGKGLSSLERVLSALSLIHVTRR